MMMLLVFLFAFLLTLLCFLLLFLHHRLHITLRVIAAGGTAVPPLPSSIPAATAVPRIYDVRR